ncbi:MAG: STAS domain-containing protein [Pseudomonadota bacterium]
MEETKDTTEFKLPPAVDMSSAKMIAADLCEKRGAPLTIDASDVTRIGGLGLQVLIAAKASWDADGVPLTFANGSEAFQRDIALLGAPIDLSPEG